MRFDTCTTVSSLGEFRSDPGVGGAWTGADGGPNVTDASTQLRVPFVYPGSGRPLGGNRVVAAGDGVSSAIGEGYALFCWGRNDHGQVGVADTLPHNAPQDTWLRGVVHVSIHMQNTCALLSGGDAYCWGSDVGGEPSALGPRKVVVPGPVSLLSVAGAGGRAAFLFLLRDGTLYGLGDNTDFLARGVEGLSVSLPVLLPNVFHDDVQLSASGRRACIVSSTGMRCWGADYGTAQEPRERRLESAPGMPTQIAIAEDHACIRLSSNQAYCRGVNTC